MCGCVIYLFVFSINLDISKIYHVLISLLRIAVLFDAYTNWRLFIGKFDFLCYMSGRGCICPFYNRGMTSFATFQCLSLTQLKMPLFLVDEKVLYLFRVNVILYSKSVFFLSRLQWHVLKYLSVLSVVRFMMIKTFCLICLVVVTLSTRAAWRIYSRIIPFPVQSAEGQRPYLLES